MHREDDKRMGLLSYIGGNRKGHEAHDLERESMQDPFLTDAIDGYDEVQEPDLSSHLRRMEESISSFVAKTDLMIGNNVCNSHCREETPDMEESIKDAIEKTLASIQFGARSSRYFYARYNRERRQEPEAKSKSLAATTPMPARGYKAFYKYIYDKLSLLFYKYKLTSPEADKPQNGIVVLSFDIDDKGRPVDFQIIESTSHDIAKKVIEIIEDGASWSPAGNVPAFVVVY